jgi:protein CpxP
MRTKLKITPAQDPQWQDFIKAERDGAQDMSELIEKRKQSSKAMNAVENFKNYAAITEAHEDSLKKVVPAFERLYSSLTDEQKKAADTMFKDADDGVGRRGS